MSVERLNELKQQLSTLTTDEKLDLAAFLTEQVRKDQAAELAGSKLAAPANGERLEPEDSNEPDSSRQRELQWLSEHREEYAGRYVALYGDKLVAQATNLRELHRLVKESGVKHALFARVEALDEPPFGGW